ncbi:MAG: response regulator [Pseudomonadota bacterium]|nr:response regulator [Pseudomonadota bacterium]
MSIRLQLLLFVVVGYLLVTVVFYFSTDSRDSIQEDAAGESLVVLYESAWYQTFNGTYESMASWLPGFGEKGDIWDPDDETFIDEVDSSGNYLNPIFNTIENRSLGDLQYLIEYIFEEELDDGELSFVMAYFPNGQRFYCGSALDLLGIDACSPKARPEFFSYLDSHIKDISERPRQSTLKILDADNVQTATLNQTYSFPIKVNQETFANIILGVDVRKAIEIFEDEFEVRTGIKTPEGLISLEEDYSSDDFSSESRFGIENYSQNVEKANLLMTENGSRHSSKDADLGTSITLIPLSTYLSSDKAELFIFKDEKLAMERASEVLARSYFVSALMILFIVGLTAYITYRTFGGITRAIAVLEGLTQGDHTQKMPERHGLLASKNDEVGHLSTALHSYRGHLLEMEDIRKQQAKRRKERDRVIIEKMSFLADQLEGDAQKLILEDIKKMTELAKEGDGAGNEEASVELMSLAFSRMSDEVNALISARTSEMETSRDEARDANAEKTRFFANMSHELRTPLNAILGYGEMLAEDCEDLGYDDLLPDLKKITSAGSHLLSLINNILDISKIEAGRMELYLTSFEIEGMVDTIKDVTGPLAATNDNGFKVNLEDALGSMTQDETKIRQCLTNFLSNGFKFTSNGTVTLDVDTFFEEDVEMIRFSVSDTGEGMSEEGLSKVFREYEQAERSTSAKHGGTGLGLPITKKLAEMMGGDVIVTSELGVGSVFTLYVPRECPQDYDELEQGNTIDKLSEEEKIVVLIDDDVAMHDLIRRTLSKIGLKLVGAVDSEKGMQIVREMKPKLLLLDVLMPGRDGWSILKECKSDPELKEMPVVMVSQLSQDVLSQSLGADDYLTKPINRDLFLETVSKHISSTDHDGTVLIIDDDADVRDLLSRMLIDAGFKFDTAKDGKEGLEKLNKNPNLIVLDLEMPRMDGFEFLENYMKEFNETERAPVLVYSGKDLTEVQREMLEKNVAGMVKKDEVSMDELSAIVTNIYNQ